MTDIKSTAMAMKKVVASDAFLVAAKEAKRAKEAYFTKNGKPLEYAFASIAYSSSRKEDLGMGFHLWKTWENRAVLSIEDSKRKPLFPKAWILRADNWEELKQTFKLWKDNLTEADASLIRDVMGNYALPPEMSAYTLDS